MPDPRIVTPREARQAIVYENRTIAPWDCLAHTVVTEPERIAAAERAAVVAALLHFADAYGDPDAAEVAENVKNGADW